MTKLGSRVVVISFLGMVLLGCASESKTAASTSAATNDIEHGIGAPCRTSFNCDASQRLECSRTTGLCQARSEIKQ